MRAEGKGQVAPKPIRRRIDSHAVRALARRAIKQARERRYENGNIWRQGLTGVIEIEGMGLLSPQAAPIFIGLIGEYAAATYIHALCGIQAEIDLEPRDTGDGGIDLEFFGLTVQVKTRRQLDRPSLLKIEDNRGRDVAHPAEAFVFCHYIDAYTCGLLGYLRRREVMSPDRIRYQAWAGHMNYRIEDSELRPMGRLIREINSRRKA